MPPPPPEPPPALGEEIERLFVDLDADEFSIRMAAFERLQELSTQEHARPLLAESVKRAMVDTEISFEVRKQLERLARNLPVVELGPAPKADALTVDELLAQLADDSYARRLGAESRLRWLLGSADAVGLIYERVKHSAASIRLDHEQTQALRQIYDYARAAWLGDKARQNDPVASSEQIERLIGQIAQGDLKNQFRLTEEPTAVVELRDLLAIDANVDPIRKALEARLPTVDEQSEAARHLNELLELTKPAMVAEYWRSGRHEESSICWSVSPASLRTRAQVISIESMIRQPIV